MRLPPAAVGRRFQCAKFAPYGDRSFPLSAAPEQFDQIFDFLVQNGKALEINTASWRDGPAWGLDVLRRYRERGGELVTIGSDAHTPERVGGRVGEAVELVRAAGIRYLATYEQKKAVLTAI